MSCISRSNETICFITSSTFAPIPCLVLSLVSPRSSRSYHLFHLRLTNTGITSTRSHLHIFYPELQQSNQRYGICSGTPETLDEEFCTDCQFVPQALAVYHQSASGQILRRSYRETSERASGFAYYLKKHGYRRVGILCTNTPAFLEAIFGIAGAGAVNVGTL